MSKSLSTSRLIAKWSKEFDERSLYEAKHSFKYRVGNLITTDLKAVKEFDEGWLELVAQDAYKSGAREGQKGAKIAGIKTMAKFLRDNLAEQERWVSLTKGKVWELELVKIDFKFFNSLIASYLLREKVKP